MPSEGASREPFPLQLHRQAPMAPAQDASTPEHLREQLRALLVELIAAVQTALTQIRTLRLCAAGWCFHGEFSLWPRPPRARNLPGRDGQESRCPAELPACSSCPSKRTTHPAFGLSPLYPPPYRPASRPLRSRRGRIL